MYKFYSLFLILILFSCNNSKSPDNTCQSIICTKHLEHLYQEIEIDNNTLGIIWIYCDAPDYKLVSDEDEGYTCVDDVARALIFYCVQYKSNPLKKTLKKIKTLSEFVLYMQAPNGYYYNFLLTDNTINTKHQNSEAVPNFWSWRAFWALSELCLIDDAEFNIIQEKAKIQLNSLEQKIEILFKNSYELIEIEGLEIPNWVKDYGADQISVILLGLTNYYKIFPDSKIENMIHKLGDVLISAQLGEGDRFPYNAFLSWRNVWHAWGNSQAYSLLKAGNELKIERFVNHGFKEIDNFYSYCSKQGFFHEFYVKMENDSIKSYNQKKFPQIAYNFSPMILASIEAYNISKSEKYAVLAGQLGSWFFGNNVANTTMYNVNSGHVFDGINSTNEVNFNSGAESTIEALLSLQAIETSVIAVKTLKSYM